MDLVYKVSKLSQLSSDFVEFLYDNEDLTNVQTHNDELSYIWDIIKKHSTVGFKNEKEFEVFIQQLSVENIDNIMYYVHRTEYEELDVLLMQLLSDNITVKPFDELFFEFLIKFKNQKTLSLTIGDYVLLGGKNRKAVKKIKNKLIHTDYEVVHTLYLKFKKIYIFKK